MTLNSQETGLSDEEIETLRAAIAAEVQESPLRRHGSARMTLRGTMLATLVAKVHEAPLRDSRALRRIMEDIFEDQWEARARHGAKGDFKLILGRDFVIGAGEVKPTIVAIGSEGVVEGQLDELIAVGSHVTLGPQARVTEHLVSVGSRLEIDPEAEVTAQEIAVALPEDTDLWASMLDFGNDKEPSWPVRLGWALLGILLSLGLGLVYLRVFPRFHGQASGYLVGHPGAAFGFGVLGYLGILPVAVFLVLTLVGILFLPPYALVLGVLLWLAHITSALWLTGHVLRLQLQQTWQTLLLGLVLLKVLGFIPLVGGPLVAVATTFGFGALLCALFREVRPSQASAASKASQTPSPEHPSSA